MGNHAAHPLRLQGEERQPADLYLEVNVEEAVRAAGRGERRQIQQSGGKVGRLLDLTH